MDVGWAITSALGEQKNRDHVRFAKLDLLRRQWGAPSFTLMMVYCPAVRDVSPFADILTRPSAFSVLMEGP